MTGLDEWHLFLAMFVVGLLLWSAHLSNLLERAITAGETAIDIAVALEEDQPEHEWQQVDDGTIWA